MKSAESTPGQQASNPKRMKNKEIMERAAKLRDELQDLLKATSSIAEDDTSSVDSNAPAAQNQSTSEAEDEAQKEDEQ